MSNRETLFANLQRMGKALKLLDARGMSNKDLETILSSRRERVWEFMHYKRPLSLARAPS